VSDVLVDSTVWIDFFRGAEPAVARLDPLLADDRVAVFGPIIAEVASGARTLGAFNQVRAKMSAARLLTDPPDLWGRVAEALFHLARQGVQAHLVDLAITVTANVKGHTLLTRDKDFLAIARAVPIDLELY